MVDHFMSFSQPGSGFFLNNLEELTEQLNLESEQNQKVLLIGVTFALLDLITLKPHLPAKTMVMETGGMKGRKKELVRQELHQILKEGLGVSKIYSEYGMTELLSQAYTNEEGYFVPAPQMRCLIRDAEDPFQIIHSSVTGGINIVDLANLDSCAFIETQDLGRVGPGNSFQVLGRFDQSEVRGCSLMAI
jgi:hypothetical protein